MEQGLALLLALSLGLLQPGHGQPLHVEPPEPEVAMAVGASLQFTCSLACAGGAARVRWRGLDIGLGAVLSEAGSSVLSVHNASLSATGTRVCEGSCGDRRFQRTVKLLVYAFPDQLAVSPATLVPGRNQEVACTAHSVSPTDTLSFSLLLGNRELEGVQALGREEKEEDLQETEDLLFRVTQRWLLPPLGTPAPPTLHCQATMRLPGLELSHRRALPVLHSQTSLERPDPTSSEPPTTTSPQATPQQGSTGTPRTDSSTRTCRPEIHWSLEPALDGEVSWELLCEAACGPGMTVHWTLAPGGLAAYKRREAGAQAWLSLPPDGSRTEGFFQCRLDPGGQVVSLYVPIQKVIPKTSPDHPPAALWTGSLVLGLLLMLPLAYRLWRRCRPLPATPARLPVSLRLLQVRH
ncbi:mucosal addressin cell adhesion molecule 1 isoform X1 [Ictidomys tridecemlineatus]